MLATAPAPCTGDESMTAVKGCLNIPSSTARSKVFWNKAPSASWATIRARIKLKVVAPMPSNQSSTPIAAFQSESTLVRREVSASEVRSWVAHSMARTITEGGPKDGPFPSAYRWAKSSSETSSWPWSARRS